MISMKELIILALFIPVFASAATLTPDNVLKSFSSGGLSEVFNFLNRSTSPDTSNTDTVQKAGKSEGTRQYISYEDYIKQFMFSSDSTLATTSSVREVASKIFGSSSKNTAVKNLKDCLKVEFKGSWYSGQRGEEVLEIQRFLNQNSRTRITDSGPGSKGKETQYFGSLTKEAVKKFQTLFAKDILESVGLNKATGFWGPSTIKKANEITALCR